MSDNDPRRYGAGYNRYRSSLTGPSSSQGNSRPGPLPVGENPHGNGARADSSISNPAQKPASTSTVKKETVSPERGALQGDSSLFVPELNDEEEERWLFGDDDEVQEVSRLPSSLPAKAASHSRGKSTGTTSRYFSHRKNPSALTRNNFTSSQQSHKAAANMWKARALTETNTSSSSGTGAAVDKLNTSALSGSDNTPASIGATSSTFKVPAAPLARDSPRNGPIVAYSNILQNSPAAKGTMKPENPEITLIKSLRNEENKSWADIVTTLNEARSKKGESPSWTSQSAYSAYILSTPLTARPAAEIGFTPKDYMHLRYPNEAGDPSSAIHTPNANPIALTGGVSKAAKKRVKDWSNIKELEHNVRKTVSKGEETAELKTDAVRDMLREAKAVVERGFWGYVADEMERKGARLYSAKGLVAAWKDMEGSMRTEKKWGSDSGLGGGGGGGGA